MNNLIVFFGYGSSCALKFLGVSKFQVKRRINSAAVAKTGQTIMFVVCFDGEEIM